MIACPIRLLVNDVEDEDFDSNFARPVVRNWMGGGRGGMRGRLGLYPL